MKNTVVNGQHLWARHERAARALGFRMEVKVADNVAFCRLTPITLKALTAFRAAAGQAGRPGMDTLEMRQHIPSTEHAADALNQAINAALELAQDVVS